MTRNVELHVSRVEKLLNQVNLSEYVFCWTVHEDNERSCLNLESDRFVTQDKFYKYSWKLIYKYYYSNYYNSTRYISLVLEPDSNFRGADNKVFVNLGIKPLNLQNFSDLMCVFYKDELIDLPVAGIKKEENLSKYFKINDSSAFYNGKIDFIVNIKIFWIEKELTNLKVSSNNQLSTDFDKLYIGQDSTDVSFVFKNNKVIKAHKLILMARSPVFQAMFQSDMLEKKENRVEIEDLDPEIFEKLIRYIYTGQMKVTSEDKAADIMVGADKYALIEFRDYCMNKVIELMNVENAADNLVVSHLLNLNSLKTKAIEFILSKKQEVVKTDGYKNLLKNHLHLIAELFEKS